MFTKSFADQFVPNPDPTIFSWVDHIDRNKTNNSPENLRHVSSSLNNRNKGHYRNTVYQFLPSVPERALPIKTWRGKTLGYEYYFFEDNFYVNTSLELRQLVPHKGYVYLRKENGRYSRPSLKRLKKTVNQEVETPPTVEAPTQSIQS